MIRYHGSKPWEYDPFYNENPTEVEERFSYYGITSGPALFVEGELIESSCLLENIRDIVDQHLPVGSIFKLTATDSINGDSGYVHISVVAEGGPVPDSLRLRAAVVEDSIDYVAPNGQTLFNCVFRKFAGGSQGLPLEMAQDETLSVDLGFSIEPTWDTSHVSVVVLIQSDSDRSILQAVSSRERPKGWARYRAAMQGKVETSGFGVKFPSVLSNRGADVDTFFISLAADLPGDWTSHFEITGGEMVGGGVVLDRDSSCTIDLTIDCGYEPGTGRVTVTAQSQRDPSFSRSLDFFAISGVCGLLIDDDGGDSIETYFESALDSLGVVYGVWDRGIASPQISDLNSVDFTIWFTGTHAPTLNSDDQELLAAYLGGDGRLFITGQDIGYGLCDIISEEYGDDSKTFYESYLHASYVQSNSNLFELFGRAGDPISDGLSLTIEGGDGADNQTFPDVIDSIAPARVIFDYSDPVKHGGIRFESDSSRVVYLSFGFEAISSFDDRVLLLSRILDWFGGLGGIVEPRLPARLEVYPNPAVSWSRISLTGTPGAQVQIFDISGRLVRKASPADGCYTWDLRDTQGRKVSPGVYFVSVPSDKRLARVKVIVLK